MSIKFYVVLGYEDQLDFENRIHKKEVPVGQQHILYQDALMRGKSRSALKQKGQKHTVRINSVKNVPLCPACEKRYKANSDLSWSKWAANV